MRRGRTRDADRVAAPAAPAEATRTVAVAEGAAPARVGVPDSVRSAADWSWRLLLIGLALAVLLWLIAQVKVVVVPVAVAILLATLLTPVSSWLQRRARLPRGLSVAVTVIGAVVVITGLLVLAGRSIAHGIGQLSDKAVEGIDKVTTWLSTGPLQLSQQDLQQWADRAKELFSGGGGGSSILSGALHVGTTIAHVAAGTLIALFCTFFFLLDGRRIWAWVVGVLPRASRERVHQAGRRGLVTLGAYTRTQILVAAVDAVGIGLGALIFRVPLALPLATLVFFGSFIPVVGAVVTGALAVLVALVAHGPGAALGMLAVVLIVQQVEGHLLQPFLMGHAVSLHPVAVLLSVAAGSFVAGIVGALFAVPIAATLNTVVLYLHGHDKFPELGHDDHVTLRERGHPALDISIEQVERAAREGATS